MRNKKNLEDIEQTSNEVAEVNLFLLVTSLSAHRLNSIKRQRQNEENIIQLHVFRRDYEIQRHKKNENERMRKSTS